MATSLKAVKATALTSVINSVASAGVKITSLTYTGSATAGNPAGSETITVNGSGFNTGAKVYIDTTLCSTTYVSPTSLTFISPAKSVASYHLYVYNTDGSSGMFPLGLVYSNVPVWVTASGALPSSPASLSYTQTVSATGDGTITYSITSGSLPTGLSLNSASGAITGTTPSTIGTSTFTITATDSQQQTTSRSFSISVLNVPTSLDYLVVAGGGSGGRYYNAGGGGAGGLLSATSVSVTPGTTYSVQVGAGGAAMSGAGTLGNNGSNSSISGSGFTTVTAIGGGSGVGNAALAANGGSGGGASGYQAGIGKGVYPGSTYLSQARQGYDGGNGGTYGAGGGGGAGAAGSNGASFTGGNGGIGVQWSDGNYYAGGGGGAAYSDSQGYTPGNGGNGGGGRGATYPAGSYTTLTAPATPGTVNTGGGGGGSSGYHPGSQVAEAGGSGVVILRYADTSGNLSATTGNPTVTTVDGYRYYKFTTSGTFRV